MPELRFLNELDVGKTYRTLLTEYGVSQSAIATQLKGSLSAGSLSALLSSSDVEEGKEATWQLVVDAFLRVLQKRGQNIIDVVTKQSKSKAEQAFFSDVLRRYASPDSGIYLTREDLDSLVEERMLRASKRVVLVASLAKRYLSSDFYKKIANVLISFHANEKSDAYFHIYLEAKQLLWWRSFSLDHDVPDNTRIYSQLAEKYEQAARILVAEVRKYVLAHAREVDEDRQEELLAEVMQPFGLFEINHITNAAYIVVDDEFFVTPRTHLRGSKSYTYVVEYERNRDSLLAETAASELEFIENRRDRKYFIGAPDISEETKVKVFSDKGQVFRGILPRETVETNDSAIETGVVHGLVFNRKGELLLRRKTPREKANVGLWDKSFGTFIRSKETNPRFSAERAMKREVLTNLVDDIYLSIDGRDDQPSIKRPFGVINCESSGVFSDNVDKLPEVLDRWFMFEWKFKEEIPGLRILNDNSLVHRPYNYAYLYVLLCPDDFHSFTSEYLSRFSTQNNSTLLCQWANPDRRSIDRKLFPESFQIDELPGSYDETQSEIRLRRSLTEDLRTYISEDEHLYIEMREISNSIKQFYLEEKRNNRR